MKPDKLDFSRDFGTIHPPYHGALFWQGGRYFGNDGTLLFRDGEEPREAPAKRPAESPAASGTPGRIAAVPKTDKQHLADQLKADAGKEDVSTDGADTAEAAIDLAAWARGETNHPFFAVKKKVLADFPGINAASTRAIMQGLVAAGLISADEAGR